MSAQPAFVRTFVVAGFTAEVSVPRIATGVASAVVEWSPRVPRFEVDFTAAQRTEYQRKLMQAIEQARP